MKKFLAFIFIILIGLGVWYGLTYNGKKTKDNEDKKPVSNIDDNKLETEEQKLLKQLMNIKDYNSDKADEYVQFSKNNEDIKLDDVVKLVNNDIDKIEDLEYDEIILSLIDEDYYIKDNTVRYVNYYKKNEDLSLTAVVTNVNSNLDYEFYTNMKSTNLDDDILMIANKYYYLPEDYEPEDLVAVESGYGRGYLRSEAYYAFKEMANDAYSEGINLNSISPYRSYQTQYKLYNNYAAVDGYAKADTYSARAGSSEHQTGLAVDINSVDDSFAYTKEAKWLAENSYKYGYILRYPLGKEYITGYQYEPWHFRYVGKDVAKKIYDLDITYEEYYAYFVK